MNCKEIRELLPLYADGDLADDEREAVARHLADCDACRQRLALDRQLSASLAKPERHAVPASLRPRVMAKIDEQRRWQPFWHAAHLFAHGTTLAIWVFLVGALLTAIAIMAKDMPGVAAKPTPPPQATDAAALPVAAPKANPSQTEPPLLLSLRMVDATTGWALSNHGVLRTTDGGSHWTDVTPPYVMLRSYAPPSGEAFAAWYFLDADSAWVVAAPAPGAANNVLLRTVDGGRTWVNLNLPTGMGQLTFVDRQHGWFMASQGVAAGSQPVDIYRTQDGGGSWELVASAKPDGQQADGLPFGGLKVGLGFKDADTGWLVGFNYASPGLMFYVTHDGGRTWREQTLPVPAEYQQGQVAPLNPPRFYGSQDGVFMARASGQSAATFILYLTRDGGANWFSTTPLADVKAFTSADVMNGWAIVQPQSGLVTRPEPAPTGSPQSGVTVSLYRTSDGGKKWTPVSGDPALARVSGLDFVSDKLGWAYALGQGSAVLLRTTDGGQTWEKVPLVVGASPSAATPVATTVAPPTPPATTASAPACTAGDLSATVAWQGATGNMAGSVVLINKGDHACTLNGQPGLEFVDASGAALPVTQGKTASRTDKPMGTTPLQSGAKAWVFFVWGNYCGDQPSGTVTARVTLPDDGGQIVARPDGPNADKSLLPRCDAPGNPSNVTVGPFTLVEANPPQATATPAPVGLRTDLMGKVAAVALIEDPVSSSKAPLVSTDPNVVAAVKASFADARYLGGRELSAKASALGKPYVLALRLTDGSETWFNYYPGGRGPNLEDTERGEFWFLQGLDTAMQPLLSQVATRQGTPTPTPALPPQASPGNVAGAVQTLLDYVDAINQQQYEKAYNYWADGGAASGQTLWHFGQGYANTVRASVLLGEPAAPEAGAGVAIPLTMQAVINDQANNTQRVQYFRGTYTLKPAATAGGWEISSATVEEFDGGNQPLPGTGDAVTLLTSYFDAISRHQYPAAYTLWDGLGGSSGQTFAEFQEGYANTFHVDVVTGTPLNQGAAGSSYADIPVVIYAYTGQGDRAPQTYCGTYTARHLNVPPFDLFGWRIEGAKITPTASVQPGSAEEKRLLEGGCTP